MQSKFNAGEVRYSTKSKSFTAIQAEVERYWKCIENLLKISWSSKESKTFLVCFPAGKSTTPAHRAWTRGAGQGEDLRHHKGLSFPLLMGGLENEDIQLGGWWFWWVLISSNCMHMVLQNLVDANACARRCCKGWSGPRSRPNSERKFHRKVLERQLWLRPKVLVQGGGGEGGQWCYGGGQGGYTIVARG